MRLKLLAALLGFLAMASSGFSNPTGSGETVVLLHGLGRTRASLWPLACALERAGYQVINVSYPSRRVPLATLAETWLPAQLAAAQSARRVHFVTHSMGGILVRLWLQTHDAPANLGRVVMLAPPNQGSEVADALHQLALYRWTTGPNGAQMTTRSDALPAQLGEWPKGAGELGVLAGTVSLNPLLGRSLPAPHDGKVSVASTHLTGESDHQELPFSHTWIACRSATHAAVLSFLQSGRFPRVAAVSVP